MINSIYTTQGPRQLNYSNAFYSLVYTPFTSLVKFIPQYFIVFYASVNWVVFFISFSDIKLLVYRNTTNFYVLIICLAILLNLLISSSRFLVEL